MLNKITTLPQIPSDAIIKYVVPTSAAGKYNDSKQHSLPFNTEEEARKFASSGRSNGSGYIAKIIIFTQYYANGETVGHANFQLKETLKPVTKFDEEGQVQHKKYLKLINCKHSKTRTVSSGAGCSFDVDTKCVKCGDFV